MLIAGSITKDHIGTAGGSIIQVMIKDYGVKRTVDFMTDIYFMMNEYLNIYVLSIGLEDCKLGENYSVEKYTRAYNEARAKLIRKINSLFEVGVIGTIVTLSDLEKNVEQYGAIVETDEYKAFITISAEPFKEIQVEYQKAIQYIEAMGVKVGDPVEDARREASVQVVLDSIKDAAGRAIKKYMADDNPFKIMAESGSKGCTANIAQTSGILGQQFVNGSAYARDTERRPSSDSLLR